MVSAYGSTLRTFDSLLQSTTNNMAAADTSAARHARRRMIRESGNEATLRGISVLSTRGTAVVCSLVSAFSRSLDLNSMLG